MNAKTKIPSPSMESHEFTRLDNGADLDPLLDAIGDARYVLLGEASHGTHEYYTWRTLITKRLIAEKHFSFIAVEGDWPDCYRLNRYVKGYTHSGNSAEDVLHAFNRWPTWMWANWETVALAEWLKKYNTTLPRPKRIGFYGLDVYSLWESLQAITQYLEKTDPAVLRIAHQVMDCFEPHNVREGFSYADRTYGLTSSCHVAVENLLSNIQKNKIHYNHDPEAVFSTEQNAVVAVNAERYYKVMLRGGATSWNIRDRHMHDTINRLMKFHGSDAKVIIWEHNTHIGDARATDMRTAGMINVGQLVKQEHHAEGVFRVGFGSYEGTVMAAYHWGGEMYRMRMPLAKQGSWEHYLHETGPFDKYLLGKALKKFTVPLAHRAIGVVYDPDMELGNYVPSLLPERYEAFVFVDKTKALHPLHIEPDGLQMPETYPWGI
jgi:erythromycin esterase-like protein